VGAILDSGREQKLQRDETEKDCGVLRRDCREDRLRAMATERS
jgi:hypothetical protein